LALPLLETYAAKGVDKVVANVGEPKRLVFMGGGYGFTLESFFPEKAGKFKDIGLTPGLKPLEKHRDDVTLISNLYNRDVINPHGGSLGYLAGSTNKVSCDQVAAQQFGKFSRYPSLVLTAMGDKSGHGSGAMSLSTSAQGKPMAGIKRPIDLYFELFAGGSQSPKELQRSLKQKRSILDIVSQNGTSMKRRLAKNDQEKLNEYFDSLRDIEVSLQRQAEWAGRPKPKASIKEPDHAISGVDEVKLMLDMVVIALQTDSTRVATYRFPVESILKSLGVSITAHAMSHYKFSPTKRLDSEKRDQKVMELVGYFLDKLKVTKDVDGRSLYETTIVSYGSNLRSAHTTKSPVALFAGGGAKNLKRGEHIVLPGLTNVTNYWHTILQEGGVKISHFNGSEGPISELFG